MVKGQHRYNYAVGPQYSEHFGPENVSHSEIFIILKVIKKYGIRKEQFSFFYHNSTCHYGFSGGRYTELFAVVSSVMVRFHCRKTLRWLFHLQPEATAAMLVVSTQQEFNHSIQTCLLS